MIKRFLEDAWLATGQLVELSLVPYCFAEDMWVATVNFWFPERP